jgi:ATP-dependent Clp protease ATP-binding subunit ClpA
MECGTTGDVCYTPGLKAILILAWRKARECGHAAVSPAHYLLAIATRGGGLGTQLLQDLRIEPSQLEQAVRATLAPPDDGATDSPDLSATAERVLKSAETAARNDNRCFLSTEHLFLAIMRDAEPEIVRVIESCGVSYARARQAAEDIYERMGKLMDEAGGGRSRGETERPQP